MNVRTVSNPIVSIDQKPAVENKTVQMNESHQDRDADGKRDRPEQDQSPLSEEELKQAHEYLENLESLKASSLVFVLVDTGPVKVFEIRDSNGAVVRRIPEHEMRQLSSDKDKPTGKIFDRAS
jgi:uncharacterized FlaG/YvyC family protein